MARPLPPARTVCCHWISAGYAIDGIEQSGWDAANGMFFVNIPQVPTSDGTWQGEVAEVNPRTMSVDRSFPVPGCSPAGMAIDTASQHILLGCSGDAVTGDTAGGVTYPPNHAVSVIMNASNGHVTGTFSQVGGSGGPGGRWLGNFPTAAPAHSVAADSANGHVFVPIPGYGIAVFTTTPG